MDTLYFDMLEFKHQFYYPHVRILAENPPLRLQLPLQELDLQNWIGDWLQKWIKGWFQLRLNGFRENIFSS
jgi:hypothetical protein